MNELFDSSNHSVTYYPGADWESKGLPGLLGKGPQNTYIIIYLLEIFKNKSWYAEIVFLYTVVEK